MVSETITFDQTFYAEIMKRVIKFKSAADDSTETMYLSIQRFRDIKIENGKVVNVKITIETA